MRSDVPAFVEPEGWRGEDSAERSAAPESRAAVREAKGRLGPGNLEGEARKYAGPYPRAAKGEGAGEVGEGGTETLLNTLIRSSTTGAYPS